MNDKLEKLDLRMKLANSSRLNSPQSLFRRARLAMNLSAESKRLAAEAKTLRDEILGDMDAAKMRGTTRNGQRVGYGVYDKDSGISVTIVEKRSETVDEEGLQAYLTKKQWEAITVRVIDLDLLDAAVEEGIVPSDTVKRFVTNKVTQRYPLISIPVGAKEATAEPARCARRSSKVGAAA
jgi:hypothetical protein